VRVHLIDGTYELFRAHFSKRPDRPLKATVGVVQSLINLLWDQSEECTHAAIAFDNPIVSFRNQLYEGYKSDEGIDPVLRAQFDPVEEACAALGFVVWSMKEFEADDALAAGAFKYAADPRVTQVRLLTPDKDMNQCLVAERIVQIDRMRQKMITAATCKADRGIEPQSIPDFLALTGDTADGFPGIDGWGEKSAATVLAHYLHLEAIPKFPYEWQVKPRGADRLAASLDKDRDAALLYRKLATLRTDAPVPQSLDELKWNGPAANWKSWCEKNDAADLISRPPRRQ
jgi:5'-3' exonuclease